MAAADIFKAWVIFMANLLHQETLVTALARAAPTAS
jgi:hypothetical protein